MDMPRLNNAVPLKIRGTALFLNWLFLVFTLSNVSVKRIAVLRGKVKDEIIAFVKQCRVYVVIVKYMEAA